MALTQTRVSQLYVAIFNRASEGEGNEYWQDRPDAATAATAMLDTTDAKEYFGTSLDTDQAFIEHIYLNTLNKTLEDDPDGIAYWVGRLADGASRGQVVADLVAVVETYGPDGYNYNLDDAVTMAAYSQFMNRVAVSDYMADTVYDTPADYARTTAFDKDLVVTDDENTVIAAMAAVDALAGDIGGNSDERVFDRTVAVQDLAEYDAGDGDVLFTLDTAGAMLFATIFNFDAGDAVQFQPGNDLSVILVNDYNDIEMLFGEIAGPDGAWLLIFDNPDITLAQNLADVGDALNDQLEILGSFWDAGDLSWVMTG